MAGYGSKRPGVNGSTAWDQEESPVDEAVGFGGAGSPMVPSSLCALAARLASSLSAAIASRESRASPPTFAKYTSSAFFCAFSGRARMTTPSTTRSSADNSAVNAISSKVFVTLP